MVLATFNHPTVSLFKSFKAIITGFCSSFFGGVGVILLSGFSELLGVLLLSGFSVLPFSSGTSLLLGLLDDEFSLELSSVLVSSSLILVSKYSVILFLIAFKEMLNDHRCYNLPLNEFYQDEKCSKYWDGKR